MKKSNLRQNYVLRRFTGATLAIGLVTLFLTACGEEGVTKQTYGCKFISHSGQSSFASQTVAIIAPTNNFVSPETIADKFSSSASASVARKNSKFDVVLADGAPRVVSQKYLDSSYQTSQDFDKEAESVLATVKKVARCATGKFWTQSDHVSTVKESDLLAALTVGSNSFLPSTKDKRIFVVSNGIQTAGAIKMQDAGRLPSSTQAAGLLSRGLSNLGQLPNLRGVKVYWYGIGQTQSSNQSPLSTKTKAALASFWASVIKLSGGTLVEIQQEGLQSDPPGDHAIKMSPVKDVLCPLLIIDTLEYKPDTAQYLNLATAKSEAKRVVKEFKKSGDNCQSLTVTGYAASGRSKSEYLKSKASIDKSNLKLTLLRAKAFEGLLKAAGFRGLITAVGHGTGGPDWASNGKPDPVLQEQNRRIEVTN